MVLRYLIIFCLLVNGVRLDTTTPSNRGCYRHNGGALVVNNFTAATGSIRYPTSGSYEAYENRGWLINVPSNFNRIELFFTYLDISDGDYYDSVTIYDGEDRSAPMIVSVCSNNFLGERFTTTGDTAYVHFNSDSLMQLTGFNLTWTAYFAESLTTAAANNSNWDQCYNTGAGNSQILNTVYLTAPSGIVQYPTSNQSYYSANENRAWSIALSSYYMKIRIEFTSWNTENYYDAVRIYDGASQWWPLVAAICSEPESKKTYFTTWNYAFIHFTSDSSQQGLGFTFTYEGIRETQVEGSTPINIGDVTTARNLVTDHVTGANTMWTTIVAHVGDQCHTYSLGSPYVITLPQAPSGVITYTENGSYYSNNENRAWRIPSYGSYSRIRMHFIFWDVEGYLDSVALYDGDSESARRIAEICSYSSASPSIYYYSTGPIVFVHFKTDYSGILTGFSLQYEFIDESYYGTTPMSHNNESTSCNVLNLGSPTVTYLTSSSSGYIKYPQAGNYATYENQAWTITVSSSYSRIQISFNYWNVEEFYDTVSIYDGPDRTSRLIATICRQDSIKFYYYTNGNQAFIHFQTDSSGQSSGFELYYTGIDEQGQDTTARVTTPVATTPTISPTNNPWPRGQDLLGFWPMDGDNRLNDLSGKGQTCWYCRGVLDTEESGPFGQPQTSYHARDAAEILDLYNVRPASSASSSMTVSLFVRVPVGSTGGLLSFTDSRGDEYLQADIISNQNRPFLRVRGPTKNSADVYGVYEVLQPNEWSFFSIVIEKSSWAPCMLSIHGRHGNVYSSEYLPKICETLASNVNLRVGYSAPNDGSSYLSPNVSVSCLTLHSAALSASEARQVHDSCRTAHGTPPCGSPMIPYPAIPLETTTVPKYGQFPWMASLRTKSNPNSVLCSASILDRFMLLSSASCFSSSKNAADYLIHVGDLDVDITEKYEYQHNVRNIWVHPSYNGTVADIAVIELTSAIDFESSYVNTVCLPDFPSSLDEGSLSLNAKYYFYGWGKNGRLSVVSQSSPRYIYGSVLTSTKCTAAWSKEHNQVLTACFESAKDSTKNVPCSGDEGGPLMVAGADVLGSDNLKPVAIYSKRSNDCASSTPALFTQIAPYAQWITQKIACAIPGYSYPGACPINNAL